MFNFKIQNTNQNSSARAGVLSLPHGKIQTPVFMPCGTKASVKGLSSMELKTLGCQILLGNTYHLHLRPGSELIADHGGLHNFMQWDAPILTDSGGYQAFSLQNMSFGNNKANTLKILPEGIEFRSYLDGSKHFFTPAEVLRIQKNLGSDIMMAIDVCAAADSDLKEAEQAMQLTHNWAYKCMVEYQKQCDANLQTLFPIVQGVIYPELRKKSAAFINSLGSFGVAIGGLSVGEPKEVMYEMVEHVIPEIDETKPRYIMGVGTPEDFVENVHRGIDMFDCVLPTRLARHGCFYDASGRKNILNKKYARDESPISECPHFGLNAYSKAYVRHLMKEKEILGLRILSMHNLWFLFDFMQQMRTSILENKFVEFRKAFYNRWVDFKPKNL